MNVNRIIRVRDGDSVNALRQFLEAWWKQYKLDAMLAPVEIPDSNEVDTQVILTPVELETVNPFAPVMLSNSAETVTQFVQEYPGARLAVMLRPCELRTLVELQKKSRTPSDSSKIVIIGVDCVGLFPQTEYRFQVESRGIQAVTSTMLRNAAEGGLRAQPLRTACQICDWPAPRGADLTIGVIGVATDKFILLIAQDEASDNRLGLSVIANRQATEYQVSHRETIVGAIADMRAGVRKKLLKDLQKECSFNDLGCLLALFANCTLCGECLKACPLYNGEGSTSQDKRSLLEELVHVSRWLTSCSGCGMCEEMCKHDVPLTLLVSALSHRIRDELDYTPGDPAQPLPWAQEFVTA